MTETSSRLLQLLSLLQARREWSGTELAERLGVSGRTIRRDVERQIRALAPGGGYVLATVHNLPPEAPPENIVAFFAAAAEFGRSAA